MPFVPCLDDNTFAALADGAIDDSALSAVESHIDSCPRCAEIAAAFGRATRSSSPSAPQGGDPLLGDRLGRYEIVGWLGRGAMGHVYIAEDPRLGRKVALKIVSVAGAPELEKRLEREARAMARLSKHPNVVTVYDVGVADGRTFIAMELVEGTGLGRHLRENDMSWRAIVALFVAAGRGLAAAHEAGIVHRDFKPSNVLVAGDGQVKVGDFGLATAPTPTTVDDDAELSPIGATRVAGTPAYMAPEQHRKEPATAASDQFSFAVALWQALYGERPFAGRSGEEIRAAVLEGQRRDPPRSQVPSKIARVLGRGLAIEPTDRYPTMAAMLDDLARIVGARRRRWVAATAFAILLVFASGITALAVEPAPDPCPPATDRLAQVWDDERRGAVSETLAGASRPYATRVAADTVAALDAYGKDWLDAHHQTCEATHVRHEQSAALLDAKMACLDRRLSDLAELAKILATDPATVDRALDAAIGLPSVKRCLSLGRPTDPGTPASEASREAAALASRGRALLLAGQYDDAGDHIDRGLGLVSDADAELRAELEFLAGRIDSERAKYTEAEAHFLAAAQAAAAGGDDRGVAAAWTELVRVVGIRQGRHDAGLVWATAAEREITRLGRDVELELPLFTFIAGVHGDAAHPKLAADYFQRAVALARTRDVPSTELAATLEDGGGFWRSTGNLDQARAWLEEALAIFSRELGKGHPHTAITRRELAQVFLELGDAKKARGIHLEALAALEAALGPEHPQVFESHVRVAETSLALGKLDEASHHAELATAIVGDDGDRHLLRQATTLLGRIRLAQNRPDEAAIAHRKALELALDIDGEDHFSVANQRVHLAIALRLLDRLAESEAELTLAVAALEKIHGKDSVKLAPALHNLAEVKIARKDCEGATPILERTAAVIEKAAGPDHFNVSYPLMALGDCALRRGDTDEARQRFERALTIRESAQRSPMGVAEVKFWLAKVERKNGHRRRARALAREALALLEGVEGADTMRREITRWLK